MTAQSKDPVEYVRARNWALQHQEAAAIAIAYSMVEPQEWLLAEFPDGIENTRTKAVGTVPKATFIADALRAYAEGVLEEKEAGSHFCYVRLRDISGGRTDENCAAIGAIVLDDDETDDSPELLVRALCGVSLIETRKPTGKFHLVVQIRPLAPVRNPSGRLNRSWRDRRTSLFRHCIGIFAGVGRLRRLDPAMAIGCCRAQCGPHRRPDAPDQICEIRGHDGAPLDLERLANLTGWQDPGVREDMALPAEPDVSPRPDGRTQSELVEGLRRRLRDLHPSVMTHVNGAEVPLKPIATAILNGTRMVQEGSREGALRSICWRLALWEPDAPARDVAQVLKDSLAVYAAEDSDTTDVTFEDAVDQIEADQTKMRKERAKKAAASAYLEKLRAM